MNANLVATLQNTFGFADFRPGQKEAIEHLLAGRNTLVVMPTGAGKSLVYQLASLQKPGLTLVISPLIALMKDQVDSLTEHNVPATFINSALSGEEQAARLEALAQNAYRIVYVAPERLRSVTFRQALSQIKIGLMAVDEAHCISQWGHDFRPDYLHIAAVRAQLGSPVTVALTATATPQVQNDIVRLLELPSAERIVTGFNRPNLTFAVRYSTDQPAKLRELQRLVNDWDEGAAIIYTGTRRDAEEIAEFVRTVCGLEAVHYHAGLESEIRTRVQEDFISGELPIVVATNAFGMGIDRPDVRLVAHYSIPGTLEAYYQEAGRAGRDGEAAQAVLLYSPKDRALQEWFIDNSTVTPDETKALFQALRSAGQEEIWMAPADFSLLTGLAEVKVKVGLAQLELVGALERLGDAGSRMLLRPGKWDKAAVERTAAEAEIRKVHRRRQLDQMIAYAESNACRRNILLEHFGDRSSTGAARCCDNCLASEAAKSAITPEQATESPVTDRIGLIVLDALRRLKWGVGREKLAQLLKGSHAKEMAAYGYDKSIYYGRLAAFTLQEIEELIGQLISSEYLKVIGGQLPVLRLTPKGLAAIKARMPIPLQLGRKVSPEVIARKQSERRIGNTVLVTAQMFAQGLTPSQIAVHRKLTVATVYNHLSQLIGAGKIPLSAVVENDVAALVKTAITQVGSVSAMAPIKALLPESILYDQIRCVVEAWRREQDNAGELNKLQQAILECVHFLPGQLPRSGIAKLLVGSPSGRIEAFRKHPLYGRFSEHTRDEAMREIDGMIEMGHIAVNENGKVVLPAETFSKPKIVSPTLSNITSEDGGLFEELRSWRLNEARVRQIPPFVIFHDSVLHEIARIRPISSEHLCKVKGIGPRKLEQWGEAVLAIVKKRLHAGVKPSAKEAYEDGESMRQEHRDSDVITDFLSQPHPRPLSGPWHSGWALGFHSSFSGADWNRSTVGDLTYRLKYQSDSSVLQPLVEQALALLAEHPEMKSVYALVPVPPSEARGFDPVSAFTSALGQQLRRPIWKALIKTRRTAPQKEMRTLAQKRANVAGAFAVQGVIQRKRLLVVDDLYDSGATLEEVSRTLRQAGVANLYVLTLTRTIHSDA